MFLVFLFTIIFWGCNANLPPPQSNNKKPEPILSSDIPEGFFLLEEHDLGIQISKSFDFLLIHFIHGSEALNKNVLIIDSDTLFPHLTHFCLEPNVVVCQFNNECNSCMGKMYSLTSFNGYQSMIFKKNQQLYFGLLQSQIPYVQFWEIPRSEEAEFGMLSTTPLIVPKTQL